MSPPASSSASATARKRRAASGRLASGGPSAIAMRSPPRPRPRRPSRSARRGRPPRCARRRGPAPSSRVRLEIRVGQVRDERARPLGERPARHHPRGLAGARDRALGRQQRARVVRQHQHAARARASIAATISAVEGSSPTAPRSTTARAPSDSASARLPSPREMKTMSQARSGASRSLRRHGLRVHVADLDAADHARRGTDAERAAGIVRVHVHLEGRRCPDDQDAVPERRERRLERGSVDLRALHEEARAVAVARGALVERRRASRRSRARAARAALEPAPRAAPASSPRTSSTRPAPPASTTPASRSRGSCSGVRASARSPAASAAASAPSRSPAPDCSRAVRHRADDGQHRALDRHADRRVGSIAAPSAGRVSPRFRRARAPPSPRGRAPRPRRARSARG